MTGDNDEDDGHHDLTRESKGSVGEPAAKRYASRGSMESHPSHNDNEREPPSINMTGINASEASAALTWLHTPIDSTSAPSTSRRTSRSPSVQAQSPGGHVIDLEGDLALQHGQHNGSEKDEGEEYNDNQHFVMHSAMGNNAFVDAHDVDNVQPDEEDDLSSDPPAQRSEGEWNRIGEEIGEMEVNIHGMSQFEIVDKLGEGTFSSVYKAIDKNHYLYDNSTWTGRAPGPPPCSDGRRQESRIKPVYVALKRIYVTSSPQRILNELELMEDLRSCRNIAYLITAFRTEDQIVAVMPYSRHTDFREYYRIMPLTDLRCYFRCLFTALAGTHASKIIHRDVKPANFLYDPRTGEGTLCDFGLAERFDPQEWRGKCHHSVPNKTYPHGKTGVNKSVFSTHTQVGGALHESSRHVASDPRKKAMAPPERVGVVKEDTRPSVRANRAGTRGFRAPEVLLKCQDQTTAIDIWSAGIIMLAFLTRRFPLFNANDDIEALLELMVVFGKGRISRAALLHNRTLHCNIPFKNAEGFRIPDFIRRLNPSILDPPPNHPDPDAYVQEVQQAMDVCRWCLQVDLTRRCTADEALGHPFFSRPYDTEECGMSSSDDDY